MLERTDDVAQIDFFSGLANYLSSKNLISDREVSALKAAILRHRTQDDVSFVSFLFFENSEFLFLLEQYFGLESLQWNLLHFTVAPHLQELRKQLQEFATLLLDRADLLFNRPLWHGKEKTHPELTVFAKLLTELAETLTHAVSKARTCEREAAQLVFVPQYLNPPATLDGEEIAKTLGFGGVRLLSTLRLPMSRNIREFAVSLRDCAQCMQETIDTLAEALAGEKCRSEHLPRLRFIASEILQESLLLENTFTASLGDFFGMESCRLRAVKVFESVAPALRDGRLHFEKMLTSSNTAELPKGLITAGLARHVQLILLQRGILPSQARQAAVDLADYCRLKKVGPHELIRAELKQVNNHLEALSESDILSLAQSADVLASFGDTKSATRTLQKHLQGLLSAAPLLFLSLCLLSMLSCGVKTTPVSDVDDFRPALPFRSPEKTQAIKPPPPRAGSLIPPEALLKKPASKDTDK